MEFVTEEHQDEGHAGVAVSRTAEVLYPIGVARSMDLDAVGEHTSLVVGVNLGYGFVLSDAA